MSNKLELINKLRDIRDEISDIDMDITANDYVGRFYRNTDVNTK